MRVFLFLLALLAMAGNSFAAESQSCGGQTSAGSQADEVARLKHVIAEKNKAIDLAITAIKRLKADVAHHPAFVENKALEQAFVPAGWEPVVFRGVGRVEIKPVGDRTIVRVTDQERTMAARMILTRSYSLFQCNKENCFVIPSEILSQPKQPASAGAATKAHR